MNESKILSLQVARERACQAKAASDRQISKRSNQRLLERLEAENAQLRDCVVELMLEMQALHDGAKYSCRHLTDLDDDTLAKTWLHDVNTTPMKFSERTPNHLSGCPLRPVTLKKVVSGHSLRA